MNLSMGRQRIEIMLSVFDRQEVPPSLDERIQKTGPLVAVGSFGGSSRLLQKSPR